MLNTDAIFKILDQLGDGLLEIITSIDLGTIAIPGSRALKQMSLSMSSAAERTQMHQLDLVTCEDPVSVAFAIGAAASLRRERAANRPAKLVLSGPDIGAGSARDTSAAIAQLINGAKEECLLLTYVFSHADIPLDLLTSAARRSVKVTCIFDLAPLNTSDIATNLALSELVSLGADVLCWDKPHGIQASMHAKGVVADRKRCLITSANLTGRALTQNVGLGVLLSNPSLGEEIVQHFERLIKGGWLREFGGQTDRSETGE
jgi:phosphatidylserine/phosphatidylglycerophosphate/cardiolipin synthase-like enzyme